MRRSAGGHPDPAGHAVPGRADDRLMSVFISEDHHAHDPSRYNRERPERVDACADALRGLGIELEPGSPAARSDLERVHAADYLDRLKAFCEEGGGLVVADTAATRGTYEAAVMAAGTCIGAVSRAFERNAGAFCLVRPPGHHAMPEAANGYCFINHVAVSAEWAIAQGLARRVAIVDFDVHHGDGTQAIFYDRSDVLYISLHQWPWYPGSGALQESGVGGGERFTVNVPLPAMTGDDVYLAAFDRLVLPILRNFAPDLILVSAGFDAHIDDPLGLQQMSSAGFGHMTSRIRSVAHEICDERVVMSLEGGYSLWSLAESVAKCVRSLKGPIGPTDVSDLSLGFPYSEHALDKVIEHHRGLWSIL